MNKYQVTIETLEEIQNKYTYLQAKSNRRIVKDYYYKLIQAIDDIIEDIKEEE